MTGAHLTNQFTANTGIVVAFSTAVTVAASGVGGAVQRRRRRRRKGRGRWQGKQLLRVDNDSCIESVPQAAAHQTLSSVVITSEEQPITVAGQALAVVQVVVGTAELQERKDGLISSAER